MHSLTRLLSIITTNYPTVAKIQLDEVERVYTFAEKAHDGQKRASGVDYIQHPLGTAEILAESKLPLPIVMAGLLHDVPEETKFTLNDIKKEFGADISDMVEGITKVGHIKYRGIDRYVENLRKMFVAMADDVRVIIIKFADRLDNLQTLFALPANKQKRIALETLEIYAPIANRLGMGDLQGRLEDAAFKYAYPEEYQGTDQLFKQRAPKKEKVLDKMIELSQKALEKENIKINRIFGRKKKYYSLYRKLLKYDKNISQIYDIMAARIIADDIPTCYAAMGIIHAIWKPVKGRIKDYIAQPKPNGYQSLHTTVFGEDGEIIEFQIRTVEMDDQAELGIASHWQYKEKLHANDKKVVWIEDLVKWMKSQQDKNFLGKIKIDIFQNRIFVFTPNGDVIDLPDGATPIDFAYHIHTGLGNQCSQALINNEIAALDCKLRNGDIVKIVIDKNRKGPSAKWLDFVKTSTARHHILNYTKKPAGKNSCHYKNKNMKKLLFAFGLLLIIFAPAQQFIYAQDATGTCSCEYATGAANNSDCDTEKGAWDVAGNFCLGKKTYTAITTAQCDSNALTLDAGSCDFTADAVPPSDSGAIPPDNTGAIPPDNTGTTPKSAPAGGESTYELPNFLGITDPNILINRIIRAILGVTGSAALIIFIYGGFLWLTSAGSDTKVQKGTNAMKWAAIGLVVIFSTYVLVSFILTSLETAAIK
ncbi:MAG: RelA/SpoT family protein [Candidatus Falkowbacteria bacterium]